MQCGTIDWRWSWCITFAQIYIFAINLPCPWWIQPHWSMQWWHVFERSSHVHSIPTRSTPSIIANRIRVSIGCKIAGIYLLCTCNVIKLFLVEVLDPVGNKLPLALDAPCRDVEVGLTPSVSEISFVVGSVRLDFTVHPVSTLRLPGLRWWRRRCWASNLQG